MSKSNHSDVRVFARKPYVFHREKGEPFRLRPMEKQPIPKWVTETELYQLALAAGNIRESGVKEQPAAGKEPAPAAEALQV